ncbi:guanine nucleotide-binding protein subunit beta-like protein 1 isoform X1 [Lontra canadensis]|uniref:guanine nucleotide-binding protein subunit beta-like protein 1 isoform X1 n=2 Tax=Lontra canadensis TaxID=76717 RepID=UPI0013F2F9EF|nr:guanine nucleotide-binding protein subunit beta-like protein 1 isoform X1 [Lontra canadensis]
MMEFLFFIFAISSSAMVSTLGASLSDRQGLLPTCARLITGVGISEVPAPPASMAANPLPPPDPQFVLRGTQSAVHALHFFRGAQGQGRPLLLSGSLSGLVHIWSLQTRRTVATLDGHGGQCVTWLQTLPQGHQLLSQGRDLKLRLWDLAEGRNTIVDSVALESMGFCRSSVLAGAQERWMLAVPGRGSDEVQILEMPSKTSVCTLKPKADAKPGMPMCLELWQADSSPRPLLLAGYEDGSVALWDVSERKVCSRVACHTEPVMGFDFDSQKARGVSGSAEKALAVWSLDEQQALQVCRTHELTNPGIADVKIRPDRKILATAGWDHRVRVFHWRTMKPLAVLSFHSATVHCVAFAADGLLAAGSGDQRISIWSLYPTHSDMSAPLLGHAEGREVGAHAVA